MTDRADQVEAFASVFAECFGIRAVEVAERQREQARGTVRARWQQIVEVLPVAAFSPA
ncbi:hypothetical protein [Sphingomonas sp. BK345]|uniref:hypothetical protein n=1 Tax=Sphingomonas sp. BK345 TaxID=2586980 RepID=UPI00160E88BF|nr:hypothetical protein [Sphingomonas sp. BK345]MBB3474814.1 hypothetical protein [Sphingomonas sp. BK345]